MAQNLYDDPAFFAAYSRLDRSVEGLDGAAEWPALRAMLPELRGLRVVDLGCGYGWFCRWARAQGAAVLGIDVSEQMLARARDAGQQGIEYRLADLERLPLPAASFDLAYSSLALHYIENLSGGAGRLSGAPWSAAAAWSSRSSIRSSPPRRIRPGRTPTAANDGRSTVMRSRVKRVTNWLVEGVVKQHRTLATYFNSLIEAGFAIRHVEEWSPTDAQIAARPSLAEERDRPMFLLVSARRS